MENLCEYSNFWWDVWPITRDLEVEIEIAAVIDTRSWPKSDYEVRYDVWIWEPICKCSCVCFSLSYPNKNVEIYFFSLARYRRAATIAPLRGRYINCFSNPFDLSKYLVKNASCSLTAKYNLYLKMHV